MEITLDAPAAPVAGPTPRCDVLIADDTGPSRELLASIIRNFAGRLEIREARNGNDALAMWQELRPRITLLDIDMPGLDGLSTLKRIREADPNAFVAMISGVSSVEHVREALSGGASGFVIKPYKPQRILDLLTRYTHKTGHDPLKPG